MTGKEFYAYANAIANPVKPKVTYRDGCKVITTSFDWCEYDEETFLWTFRSDYGILNVREENVLRIKLR